MAIAILTLLVAFAATLAVSLPADWAWRRGGLWARVLLVALNVAGIVVVVWLLGRLGWYRSPADIMALVAGIVLAGIVGNSYARRAWGRAPYPG